MRSKFLGIKLGAAMVVIYLLQLIFPAVTDFLAFNTSLVSSKPWTILSSVFVHSVNDYMHLLNNMFFLVVFGTVLEHYLGWKRFAGLFVLSGMFANVSAFFFYQGSTVLGASGAISGIVACLAVIKPRKIGIFWGVPLPMWLVFLGWVVTNLVSTAASSNVAYEAHLFGLFFGAVAGLFFRDGSEEDGERFEMDEESLRRWEERHMRE